MTTTTATTTAPPWSSSTRWLALALVVDFMIMWAMVALDVRDIWFKTNWIGPGDSHSFAAIASQTLQTQLSLADAIDFNRSIVAASSPNELLLPRDSGWSSFLSKCDDLVPISNGPFFLHALGLNCSFGGTDEGSSLVVPQLVLANSGRADSIAWAACRLLRNDRKPVICRSSIVKGFAVRYSMAETPAQLVFPSRDSATYTTLKFNVTSPPTVLPHSAGESELLELLGVLSRTGTLISRTTCVEGFAYNGAGRYTSNVFGCGSAMRFESAFVGHFATDFASLHQNKAWITADALELLGMAFLIRQNCWSLFHIVDATDTSPLWLEHQTRINFSSSGMLYVLAVAIDVVLLVVNLLSSLEIAKLVLWPLVFELSLHANDAASHQRSVGTAQEPFAFKDYRAMLTCPLFRSTPLAVLMLVSQSLSWMLVLPNAIVWTWTESTQGKIQAYLSTLRVWILPLILVNLVWNVVVFLGERFAYAVTSRAYVTVLEVLCIMSVVAYAQRSTVFAIGGLKYDQDRQRNTDVTSFARRGLLAFGNGFPESLDAQQNTSAAILWTIYGPLVTILGWSLVGIALRTLLRFVYHAWRHQKDSGATATTRAVVPSSESTQAHAPLPRRYKRLPIEALLNLPIRARSLIRNSFRMETTVNHKSFLRPSCYVEHGIVMEHHKLRTRQGFFGTIRYSANAELHAMPPSPSPPSPQHAATDECVDDEDDDNLRAAQPVAFTSKDAVQQAALAAMRLHKRRRVLTPLR